MVAFDTKMKMLLFESYAELQKLEELFGSKINSTPRIMIAISDLMRVQNNCKELLNPDVSLTQNEYRFDQHLVKFVDSIQYNDLGLSENVSFQEIKAIQCTRLFEIAEKMSAELI